MEGLAAELKVREPRETVDSALVKALEMASHSNTAKRTLTLLTAYLQRAASLNQKEVVGLCRFFLQRKVGVNTKMRDALFAFCQAIARLGVKDAFCDELDLLSDSVIMVKIGCWRGRGSGEEIPGDVYCAGYNWGWHNL